MDAAEVILLLLRVFHALAALVWLAGGIYYAVAIRPQIGTESPPDFVVAARRAYAEWSRSATVILLASGTVLMFDGLSSGRGGLAYAGLLAAKVGAALVAFWIVMGRRRQGGRPRSRTDLAIALGLAAFVLGVLLSSIWEAT